MNVLPRPAQSPTVPTVPAVEPEKPVEPPPPKESTDGKNELLALLVGCTRYENFAESWQLTGPANDVVMVKKMLEDKFKFDPKNIVCLTENEGKPALRPTRANIEREFKLLAAKARAGDQVFVLLSGHGSRQPEFPELKTWPFEPEPDGMDEVYMPADAKAPDPMSEHPLIINGIIDDEIGIWLKAITDKEAYVSAVFDCCHSGTMDRGGEVAREIPARVLIPEAALEAAAQRAAKNAKTLKEGKEKRPGWLPNRSDYLVTVAACRADEITFEARLPPRIGKHHGLLSYTMCRVLNEATAPLSWKEVVHRIQVNYAGRPGGSPTPTVEGAGQDREVLGVKSWPGRSNITIHAINCRSEPGLEEEATRALEDGKRVIREHPRGASPHYRHGAREPVGDLRGEKGLPTGLRRSKAGAAGRTRESDAGGGLRF